MKVEGLYKAYGDKKVLDGLSFTASAGITGIFGPSGIGKTTLLRIIAGLEKPDCGKISDVGKISFCFQEPRLLPWKSALENASIAERKQGLAREILVSLGLGDDLALHPGELSGGMQKRVALSRSLAARFDTLLLDEPFAGLDNDAAEKAFEAVRQYADGKCVLLVSHDGKAMEKADNIIYIHKNGL